MTVKTERPETMRKVLEMLEKKQKGNRVFRYMEDSRIIEISAEQFFRDIRRTAELLETYNLAAGISGLWDATATDGLLVCARYSGQNQLPCFLTGRYPLMNSMAG